MTQNMPDFYSDLNEGGTEKFTYNLTKYVIKKYSKTNLINSHWKIALT